MSKNRLSVAITGVVVSLLGLLWLLQGSDLVHLKPILCFANCVPLAGKSVTWQVIGAITLTGGVVMTYAGLIRLRR